MKIWQLLALGFSALLTVASLGITVYIYSMRDSVEPSFMLMMMFPAIIFSVICIVLTIVTYLSMVGRR